MIDDVCMMLNTLYLVTIESHVNFNFLGGDWWSRHREAKTQGPSRVGLLTKLPGPNGVVKSCSSSKKKPARLGGTPKKLGKSLSLSRSYILQ